MAEAGSFACLVVGAMLFGVVTRMTIPPLTWVALTLLLHASRSMTAGAAVPAIWIAFYVALAIADLGILPVDGPPYFAIVAALATVMAVPFAADRLAAPRLAGVRATLVFPMALVTAEVLRSRLVPGATWGSLAYTQYGYLALMQVAAVAGIWGLTFLMGWFASTLEMAWSRGFDWSVVGLPVLTCAAILGTVLGGGAARVASAPTDRATVRVAESCATARVRRARLPGDGDGDRASWRDPPVGEQARRHRTVGPHQHVVSEESSGRGLGGGHHARRRWPSTRDGGQRSPHRRGDLLRRRLSRVHSPGGPELRRPPDRSGQ
jgi:hypothetical protein